MNRKTEEKGPYGKNRYQKMIASSVDSSDEDHIWLITLSDLLSLLLVFFIIFFALSRIPGKKKETTVHSGASHVVSAPASNSKKNENLDTIQKEVKSTVTALGMDEQVMIQVGVQEVLITMKENVTFRTGEADLLKDSKPILDTVAEMVKRYPSFQVEIDGHTDDQPINTSRFPSNWELSVARATSVLKYLMTSHGLDPARFIIKGNAEQRPVSPNWTPEQRAKNRRVEIRLKDQYAAG